MIKDLVVFLSGAVCGTLGTYFYMNLKNEEYRANLNKKFNEKLDYIQKHYCVGAEEIKKEEEARKAEEKLDDIIREEKYKKIIVDYTSKSTEEKTDKDYIRVITEEEWRDEDDYSIEFLVYHSDRVLRNDFEKYEGDNHIYDVVEKYFTLNQDGDPLEDVIYVVNDDAKTYYEIAYDYLSYDEFLDEHPFLKEADED